jgi:hypothetical protein
MNKKNKKKEIDELNKLDADAIAQLLSNFVKIEYIDYDGYKKFENLFFEYAVQEGIKNKQTLLTMFVSHFKFLKTLKSEINSNKKKKVNIKKVKGLR